MIFDIYAFKDTGPRALNSCENLVCYGLWTSMALTAVVGLKDLVANDGLIPEMSLRRRSVEGIYTWLRSWMPCVGLEEPGRESLAKPGSRDGKIHNSQTMLISFNLLLHTCTYESGGNHNRTHFSTSSASQIDTRFSSKTLKWLVGPWLVKAKSMV